MEGRGCLWLYFCVPVVVDYADTRFLNFKEEGILICENRLLRLYFSVKVVTVLHRVRILPFQGELGVKLSNRFWHVTTKTFF